MPTPKITAARREGWFGRRTDEHFARLIASLGELEEPLQPAVRASLAPDETVRWIILAPYQGVLAKWAGQKRAKTLPWEFTPNWLLVLTASRLLLVQIPEPDQPPEILAIPLENILSLQNGTVLLFSWFEVAWAENGSPRRQTVYYNAVCERYFTDLSRLMRAAWAAPAGHAAQAPGTLSLAHLPYKFKNLLPLRVFLPDEQPERLLYRPSLWRTHLRFFRRMTAPRMTLALTRTCLVLAEEEQTGADESYGFIATCLPRAYLQSQTLLPAEATPHLHITLRHAGASMEWTLPFPEKSAADLRAWLR